MTTGLARRITGFRRCAVCKIDLRGRFVYVDGQVEELLGYSKEELFGRRIADFLGQNSQHLVAQLINERNHYETFFDAADVELIRRDGQAVSTRAVASLNFIAGNPVNFQLVLDSELSAPFRAAVESGELLAWPEFVIGLSEGAGPGNLRAWLELLRRLSGADRVALYAGQEGALEVKAAVASDTGADDAALSLPRLTPLHLAVLHEGVEYVCTDGECVRGAIEALGQAPNELVCRLEMGDPEPVLLRLIFEDLAGTDDIDQRVQRARTGIEISKRWWSAPSEQQTAGPLADVKFTVAFLEHIGVGAVLGDAEGGLVGYNHTAAGLMGVEEPGNTMKEVLSIIGSANSHEISRRLEEALNGTASVEDTDLEVNLPSGSRAELNLVRLASEPTDLSSCLVLVPQAHWLTTGVVDSEFLRSAITLISRFVGKINAQAEQLGHDLYQSAGPGGNQRLDQLLLLGRNLERIAGEVSRAVEAVWKLDEPSLTDLNLLVADVASAVNSQFPNTPLAVQAEELPKVTIRRENIRTVLQHLLTGIAARNQGQSVHVSVLAEPADQVCCLMLSDDGASLSRSDLAIAFDFRRQVQKLLVAGQLPADPLGFILARLVMKAIGGKLRVSSRKGRGTTATLSIPMSAS